MSPSTMIVHDAHLILQSFMWLNLKPSETTLIKSYVEAREYNLMLRRQREHNFKLLRFHVKNQKENIL